MSDSWSEIDLGGSAPNVRSLEDIRSAGTVSITGHELDWLCSEVERLTKLAAQLEARNAQQAANIRTTENARRAAVEEAERFSTFQTYQ